MGNAGHRGMRKKGEDVGAGGADVGGFDLRCS
jgi:hypothetical protein